MLTASEVIEHFRDMGVLADTPEMHHESPRFIIGHATRGYGIRCMKDLSDSESYYEGRDRIDAMTSDGVMVSMYTIDDGD
jgi:hypothetical protein